MEKLVGAYLDGDIPKEIYLKQKDKAMRATLTLRTKMKDFEKGRKNWVEPLRSWILDTKQADFLSSSTDFYKISSFVKKVGTNHAVRDKTAHFSVPSPSAFVATRRHFLPFSSSCAPSARRSLSLSRSEVSFCGGGGIRTHEDISTLMVFKTIRFNRSRTPPYFPKQSRDKIFFISKELKINTKFFPLVLKS